MTLPGAIQALLVIIVSVSSFVAYFRYPRHWFLSLVVGGGCVLFGLFIINMNWDPPSSLSDIWNFRAPDFYQGTVIFSAGVGVAVGNVAAWLASCILRMKKKQT